MDVFPERLVFTYRSAPSSPPAVGEVVSGTLGGGYLRTIVGVSELAPNRYELITENAQLVDYFADVHFRAVFEPSEAVWDLGDGVGTRSDALGSGVKLVQSDIVEGCSAKYDLLDLKGDFSPIFELEVDIGFWDGLKEFRFVVGGNLDLELKMLPKGGAPSIECQEEWLLERFEREFTSTFAVGFVPVAVTHTITPKGSLSITGEIDVPSVELTGTGNINFSAGAVYEDGSWDAISDASRSGDVTFEVDSEGEVSLKGKLAAGLNYLAKIYDTAGPEMFIGPYVEPSATSSLCEWNTQLEVGLELEIGAKAEVPIIDYTLVSWSTSFKPLSGVFFMNSGTWPWCSDAGMEDPCSAFTDCDSCTASAGEACGWCGGSCISESRSGECGGDFTTSRSACVDCSGFGDCGSCLGNGYCGWCPGMGCVNDATDAAASCGGGYQTLSCD
ncbi:MAG: hypothetical protein CMN30_33410 [Sandaracinus sp.]|nr:hypothetical protein [Sandaracinus sp.]